MKWLTAAILCPLLLTTASAKPTDEQGREAAIFGSTVDDRDTAAETAPDGTRETALFGDDSNTRSTALDDGPEQRLSSQLDDNQDPLVIGGSLFLRTMSRLTDDMAVADMPLSQTAQVFLYGDARPTERIRAFVRGRFDHNLVDATQGTGFATDFTTPQDGRTRALVDQLWLKFDLDRTVFLTLGQQPIRWGSARIWNPTDFVNAQRRDPLAIFDIRPGVPLVKAHIPLEKSETNIYLIGQFDGAETISQTGGVFRIEQTIAQSELSAMVSARQEQPLRLGLDYSLGVGLFELRFEGAAISGDHRHRWSGNFNPDLANLQLPERSSVEYEYQGTAGAEWTIPYGDSDSAFWTVEYFYNQLGYDGSELYPWLALSGELTPLYLGRHYVATNLALPRPGSWNETTILTSAIMNLSDQTAVLRLDLQWQLLTRLRLFTYIATYVGEQGEFRFSLDVPKDANIPELEDGLSIKPPKLDIGFWLSVTL
ncbi:MAG: hypothetical protein ACON3Z_06090 [Bradymonadia bacterium]